MESVLIVSSTESGKRNISSLLQLFSFSHLLFVSNGKEARQALGTVPFSFVIINAPLPDEPGRRLACYVAENTSATILLLVKNECFGIALSETEEEGVFLLRKPFARKDFLHIIKQGIAFQNRLSAIREENRRLQKQLAESRTINRAKCMLIQFYGMTEEEAHRYIEQQAMNLRQNKYTVAHNLLKNESMHMASNGNLVDFSY